MKANTLLNSIWVLLLLFALSVQAFDTESKLDSSWIQAQRLMSEMTKQVNPISNPSLYLRDSYGIGFTVPIDYIPDYEIYKFNMFWQNEATTRQKELYDLLRDSADNHDNIEATYTLMNNFLFQDYDFPHNKGLAFHYIDKFNNLTNFKNSTTLLHQGIMYLTGFLGEIPIDESKGLVLIQQSASLGNIQAKQTLAYKYLYGINVPRDVEKSMLLYHDIAHNLKANHYSESGWDILAPYIESYNLRLPDFNGGLLDPELTQMSISTQRKRSRRPDITSSVLTKMGSGNIVLQFGDISESSPFAVGIEDEDSSDQLVDIFYVAWDEFKGTYAKERNCTRSRELLEFIYNGYLEDVPYMDNLQKFFFCNALDLLGHLYFTGEGLKGQKDINISRYFLEMSADLLEEPPSTITSRANIDLGLISQFYFQNVTKALEYYKKAVHLRSNNGIVEYQLSRLSQEHPELKLGDPMVLMNTAGMKGYIPAKFEFAKMVEKAPKTKFDASNIAGMYKKFVEDNEDVVAPHLKDAFSQLLTGNSEAALWYYTLAAEQGFEMAQVSAASLLYQLPFKDEELPITPRERQVLAVTYYTRAFEQDNIDAGVVAGDVYYNMGDYDKAFKMYQNAAMKQSPQALWNVGYMYENGLGIVKDYHLARRYYDQVYESNHKFLFASRVTILKLELKQWLEWMNNGKDTFWRRRWHKLCFNVMRVKNYIQSWFKPKRQQHKVVIQNESQDNESIYQAITRTVNRHVEDKEERMTTGEDSFSFLGFTREDLYGMIFMLIVFVVIIIMRRLGVRGEWNVVINGVQINGGARPQEGNAQPVQEQQNPWGNFDVQFFAI